MYVYVTLGDNEGFHLISALGANWVEFQGEGSAQGQFGAGKIYSVQTRALQTVINTQISYVERITRTSFSGVQTITEWHDGSGTEELMLDRRNINQLVNIQVLSVPQTLFIIPVTSIDVLPTMGMLRIKIINFEAYTLMAPIFPKGRNNIKVTFTAGFDDFPGDILNAIILLSSAFALGNEAAMCGGGLSLSLINYSKSFGPRGKYGEIRNDWVLQAKSILKRYSTGIVGN
ncbi:hypothetical protein EHQ53_14035 [Leptospira langatensis]|uniref:Uncharacterized protein n=1 Tax=Leptospira langatensis TaxID=2484983 RepID=A0ABY2MB08_9LEPT|nr:hypothetical protein [Leptospira langatensis]TGL39637.1 hypothetical protein EHQ53_14035 [Leptospira langatensis]